ncbi:NRAC protein, partial [Crocuta crocuta]
MRTAGRALGPDSRPEARQPTRKDEEAAPSSTPPRPGREGDRTPPSILRRSGPERRSRGAEPRKTSRHVRFQEPLEVAVHCKNGSRRAGPGPAPSRPRPRGGSLLLRLCACVLLALVLGLCCGRAEQVALAFEDLRARLLMLALRLRHTAVTCWHRLLQL